MLAPLAMWPALGQEQLEDVLNTVARDDPTRRAAFDEAGEFDLAYTPPRLPRFRVNGFRQRWSISFAFRLIPSDIPSFTELQLPDGVAALAEEQRGLVLCTRATGSGKSTTLAAIVGHINASTARRRAERDRSPVHGRLDLVRPRLEPGSIQRLVAASPRIVSQPKAIGSRLSGRNRICCMKRPNRVGGIPDENQRLAGQTGREVVERVAGDQHDPADAGGALGGE
jgi:hypothetical protein